MLLTMNAICHSVFLFISYLRPSVRLYIARQFNKLMREEEEMHFFCHFLTVRLYKASVSCFRSATNFRLSALPSTEMDTNKKLNKQALLRCMVNSKRIITDFIRITLLNQNNKKQRLTVSKSVQKTIVYKRIFTSDRRNQSQY